MGEPRPDKVAVVTEVRERFESTDAALLTEYRGINVAAMQELRRALRAAGGDYKIYKNTLVRRAIDGLDIGIDDLLLGPTAIAFVTGNEDRPADAAAVAKALKDFAKTNENLVVKGGVLGGAVLSAGEADALADLPSRDVLLSQLAGALQAPLTKTARLLDALPQKFAYAMQALIEKGGTGGEDASDITAEASEAAPTDTAEPADSEPDSETETQES